ncbi:hypothetical protein MTO96_011478 [Rhipicephalus appendiculatus]
MFSRCSIQFKLTSSGVREQDDLAALGRILGHLFKAVKAEEGVNLSRLQGILSQLPRSVLGPYSANQDTIYGCSRSGSPIALLRPRDKVYTSAGVWEKHFGQKSRKPAGKQQHLASADPPAEFHIVAGKVSKSLMLYGSVDFEPPHRVSVFFDKRFFDGNRHYDLTKSWLKDNKHCAYFVIDNVDKSLLKPGKNLDDVLKAGSKVQFDAQPNPKPSTFFKLLATDVKNVPCAQSGRASDSGDEAFLSDNETAELLIETK